MSLKKVVQVFQYVRDTVYRVKIGGDLIFTTSDHPFFIGGIWRKVKDMRVGDSLTTYVGNKIVVAEIRIVVERRIVYNLR